MNLLDLKRQIYEVYEARPREARAYLGASGIGDKCKRKVWLTFRATAPVDFGGRMLRLFEHGEREEDRLVSNIRDAGFKILDRSPLTQKQFRVEAFGGFFAGHLDGLVEIEDEWLVFEAKTANQKSFNATCKHGVQKDKYTHYIQMQLYIGFAQQFWERWGMEGEPPTRALYWVVCKNSEHFYLEYVEFDQDTFDAYGEIAREIILSPNGFDRISGADKWPCTWCDHHGLCWEQELPRPACKNCANCKPNLANRKWDCARHGYELDRDGVMTVCDDHVYQPGFRPDNSVMDIDKGKYIGRITYDDGFTNEGNSEELYQASLLKAAEFRFGLNE